MVSSEVKIINKTGLHARPANLFVKEAKKYESNITLDKNGKQYNAKSIFSVLSMGAGIGSELVLIADGTDEKEALHTLKELIDSGLGEMEGDE